MSEHDVLGVCRGASPAEVRAAYRAFVRRHHPDAGGDPDRFLAGQRAYRALRAGSAAPPHVVFVRRPRGLDRITGWWSARRRPRRVV